MLRHNVAKVGGDGNAPLHATLGKDLPRPVAVDILHPEFVPDGIFTIQVGGGFVHRSPRPIRAPMAGTARDRAWVAVINAVRDERVTGVAVWAGKADPRLAPVVTLDIGKVPDLIRVESATRQHNVWTSRSRFGLWQRPLRRWRGGGGCLGGGDGGRGGRRADEQRPRRPRGGGCLGGLVKRGGKREGREVGRRRLDAGAGLGVDPHGSLGANELAKRDGLAEAGTLVRVHRQARVLSGGASGGKQRTCRLARRGGAWAPGEKRWRPRGG